jgi:GT2 family glycosyltransferase
MPETSQKIRCSVIIVSYNSLADLGTCLPSLLESCSPADEVIVVDNASTDGTAAWVQQNYPSIGLIQSGENAGFGGGNNIGAQSARGDYLAFLNPDTTVDKNWLEALILALENKLHPGLVTSKILLMSDPGKINTCGNDIHISGLTLCRGANQPASDFTLPSEVSAISGAAFAMRRDLFWKLGGFDETFFLYMEDTDLSLRTRLAGREIRYVPESVVYHDYQLTFGSQKTYYQERNRYLMLLKTLEWRTLLVLLPILLLAEIVTWGYCLVWDKNPANKLRAWAWVYQNRAEILAARQRVQALRQTSDLALLKPHSTFLAFEQATGGLIAFIAHIIFDPFFTLFWRIMRLFVSPRRA